MISRSFLLGFTEFAVAETVDPQIPAARLTAPLRRDSPRDPRVNHPHVATEPASGMTRREDTARD